MVMVIVLFTARNNDHSSFDFFKSNANNFSWSRILNNT